MDKPEGGKGKDIMADRYVIDSETGDLLYFLVEQNGSVCREYPDGHFESAEEQERLMCKRKTAK